MSHEVRYVLFGAGSAGRYTLKHLASRGIHPTAFADNNTAKWGTPIEGIPVMSPAAAKALAPDALWVATCMSSPAREIRAEIRAMGVRTVPLHEVLPCFHGPIPDRAYQTVSELCSDIESLSVLADQRKFRAEQDYDKQRPASDCKDIYFPDFIKHLDVEVFVDGGAACGDTIDSFKHHWSQWSNVTAFEPDRANLSRLKAAHLDDEKINILNFALSDYSGVVSFTANGDYSSHLSVNGHEYVNSIRLDDAYFRNPPTYIKLDVEGAELQVLWGARRIIKENAPVLAVCAYHTSDHAWEIPLLVHAINPNYHSFLRRYAEGSWELVYYFVPLGRVK